LVALREVRRAVSTYEQAIELCHASGDEHQEQEMQGHLGTAYGVLGNWDAAIVAYERALALARQARDRPSEGIWLLDLALALDEQGDRPGAVQRMQAAEAVLSQAGHSAAIKAREWLAQWEADG
jgi:tetratricopeptide (TPR) repeat protein